VACQNIGKFTAKPATATRKFLLVEQAKQIRARLTTVPTKPQCGHLTTAIVERNRAFHHRAQTKHVG
jgi:hypothetical protein